MLGKALSRRALLQALSVAVVAPALRLSSSVASEPQDVSPALMRAICAHCAAYSDLRRLARETDLAALGEEPAAVRLEVLDKAKEAERSLLFGLHSFPVRNEAERHDKAAYLLGLFGGKTEHAQ